MKEKAPKTIKRICGEMQEVGCKKEFDAKIRPGGTYSIYCPVCVSRKVWFRDK